MNNTPESTPDDHFVDAHEQQQLDALWLSLSLEDKYAVLGDALEGSAE